MNEGERCPGGLAHLPFLCHESLRLLALARPFGYYNVFWISRFPTDKQLQNFRKPKADEEAQELKTLLAPKRRFPGRKKIGSLKKTYWSEGNSEAKIRMREIERTHRSVGARMNPGELNLC
ncbi:Hypothetical protein NTJ_10236 [Nesidiocoris tenuis]|uniref:Uncharacterized protein n=1 Tax=Nesidiocoris tenuis TaxID=355587 RepID=A0ABN7AZ48_9HEMI|nr:Hypothetical protein NTJ_10236 [Nesidiocoris tenuis]